MATGNSGPVRNRTELFDTLSATKYHKMPGWPVPLPFVAGMPAQKEPPYHTGQPFVSSFAYCLQASLNIILRHADCRWLSPQT